jgi:glycolate oxidase FAD binding subunit
MSMAAAAISESAGAIVGPENVITDAEQLRAYGFGRKTPAIAVRPGSDQEVSELVRFAAAEKLNLVPTAARTKLGMNIPLREYDLALDMTRLDRVVAYDPGDLTLSVEAGLPLRRLAGVLAEHGQFLPLAVPFEERATVGGSVASGIDSPLRQFYGTARDYVLGMEFITGDGQLVKSGGRVVKNVSGYDLHKLMIGSLGSLGVITRINFRTFPAPASARAFLVCFDSGPKAMEMRNRIAQSPLRPLTLEIASPSAAELLFGNVIPTPSKRDWVLLVTFAGSGEVVERYKRDLRQLAAGSEAILLDERDASAALARVREFVPIVLDSSPATMIIKMSVLPSQIAKTLDDAARIATKEELPWAAIARGVGVIYFALLPSARDEEARVRTIRVIDALFQVIEHWGGNFTAPWYPEEWNKGMAPRKASRNDLEQMRKIKRVFDPYGIFAADPISAWT